MPKALAIAHACCPPAPPKHANTCFDVSNPRASVKTLIGLHIASFAMSIKPIAIASTDLLWVRSNA